MRAFQLYCEPDLAPKNDMLINRCLFPNVDQRETFVWAQWYNVTDMEVVVSTFGH